MILIFGANGQVGMAAAALLVEDAVAVGRDQADFSRPENLREVVRRYRPKAIFNAAAYTAVDKAEEETELARRVNADSPGVLAEEAKALGIPLIHFSTDYVFDGKGSHARSEDEPTKPLGVYGRTKREGEEAVEAAGGRYLIFRTSWVYDATGKNFLNTMLRLGAEREQLRVVADQIGAPTYAPQLAAAALQALNTPDFESGIYHLCHGGETSWHGFAEAIFSGARARGQKLAVTSVEPIPSSAYPTPAERPLNSRLDCGKAERNLGIRLPSWEEGLETALNKKFSS